LYLSFVYTVQRHSVVEKEMIRTMISVTISCFLIVMYAAGSKADDCARGAELYRQAVATEDGEERITLLRQSLGECVEYNALYQLGRAYMKADQPEPAIKALKEAASLPSANRDARSKALIALGSVHEEQDNLVEALTCYEQALRLKEYPKVRKHVFDLAVERSKRILTSGEIADAFLSLKDARAFGVTMGLDLPVRFDYDKATLTAQGRRQAAELGEALISEDYKEHSFTLLGHTDLQGDAGYNMELSKKRADAVKQFLVLNFPIGEERIKTEGYGEERPLYTGESEHVHQVNRRVEVRID